MIQKYSSFFIFEKNKGMSLLEVLLAVAVFAVGIGTVTHLFIGSHIASAHSLEKNQALLLAREGIEAARSIYSDNFENLSEGYDYGLEFSGGQWNLVVAEDVIDNKFTRKIDVVEIDSETLEIIVKISWQPIRGEVSEISLTERFTAWREPFFIKYNLNINSTPGGMVTVPGEGTYQYVYQEEALLSAEEDSGYVFVGWSGQTGDITNVNSANTTIIMNSDYEITANFEEVAP